VASAFDTLERSLRGRPAHGQFLVYARGIFKPLGNRLGWDASGEEPAAIRKLRRLVLAHLGAWKDTETVDLAQRRFARWVVDRPALSADEQSLVLPIVAQYADPETFSQLRKLAKSAPNETELARLYTAMMRVDSDTLADDAEQIPASEDIPPQAGALRFRLVAALADRHPALAFKALRQSRDRILAPLGQYRELTLAQRVPTLLWDALPVDDLEAWLKAQVSADLGQVLDSGMEYARFAIAEQERLAHALEQELATRHAKP
jgi:aminopeptidase N